jgi:hypothetical protein
MRLNYKPIFGRYLFLQALDFTILELHDLPAARAYQMIVVSLMRHVVILGLRTEVPGLGQAGFAEEIQCAVDRRQTQMRIFLRKLVVHRFGRDMFLLEERRENEFPLAGQLQLVFGEMLPQRLHFFHALVHRVSIGERPFIKRRNGMLGQVPRAPS